MIFSGYFCVIPLIFEPCVDIIIEARDVVDFMANGVF